MRKLLLIPVVLLGGIILSNAQTKSSSLTEAWKDFYVNKRTEAKAVFNEAAKDPVSAAEAHLGLCLLAGADGTNKDAFKEYSQFCRLNPEHYPYTYALWTSASVFSGYGKKENDQVAFLKQLINDPKANGTLKAMAHSTLGNHYESGNKVNDAKSEYAMIGSLEKWQFAGEFENISECGFSKDYLPLTHPEKDAVFTNKFGAEVKWFDCPGIRNDKWIDFTYYFYYKDAIIYSQTFVNSPEDQQVQFRLGVSGSLKVWLNDNMVISESDERNNDLDTYIKKVKLKKGYNRFLVQVGESEAGRSNFMARITDDNGNPVNGLTYSTESRQYTPDKSYKAEDVPIFAEDFFRKRIQSNPDELLNYVMLAETYLRNDKKYEARKTLLQAKEKAPECSYIRTKLIDLYLRDNDRTDLAISLEWMKQHDPDNQYSLNLLYNDELEKENYDNASKIITKIEKLYGMDADLLSKKIIIAAKTNKQDEMISLIEKAYKEYPENRTLVNYKYIVEKDARKDVGAATNVVKKYLKNNYDVDYSFSLADIYFEKGELQNGLKIYYDELAHTPIGVGTLTRMANVFYQVQNYSKAEDAYMQALKIAPYTGSYYAGLAKCYREEGKKDKAREAFLKALAYDPTDYDARKDLRKLDGKDDIYSNFKQPDVYELFKNSPPSSQYPDDNSLIIDEEVQKIVYSGGSSEEKHIFLLKILNAKALENWKEYYIPYTSREHLILEKAEVLKPDGSRVPAETNENHVVFTTLASGDAIHVTYRKEIYASGKLARHFWDDFYFSHGLPYQHAKYSLMVAPEIKFNWKVTRKDLTPEITKGTEFDTYTWEKSNEPAMRSESNMPKMADVAQKLYISSFPDWNYISHWYYDLADAKSKPDFAVKETVADLLKGKGNVSQREKVKLFYNYIVNNIQYSSVSFRQSGLIPQKASEVLTTRIGDCKDVSTLFVSFCREAGIQASLMLVDTRDNGYNPMVLPTIDFNHCIARVKLEDKDYFIELTSNYLPFGSIYAGMLNSNLLTIADEKDTAHYKLFHLNPVTRNPNDIVRNTELFVEDNSIRVERNTIKTAALAADMKETYRGLGESDRVKRLQEAVVGDYPGVKLTSCKFTNLDSDADTVSYSLNYEAPEALSSISNLSVFHLPWAEKAEGNDFIVNDKRSYPIDLRNYIGHDKIQEQITVHIPKGKTFAEVPKTLKYSCSAAQYTQDCKLVKGNLVITRNIKFTNDFVQTDHLNEFQDFYKKVIAADARQIALKDAISSAK